MIWYIKSYLTRETVLGYSSSVAYFLMEYFEKISGMVLALIMIIYSIILQQKKMRSLENEEKRKQEMHQQELSHKEQLHQRKLNDGRK
ncbi:MAG: hypothetical protein AAF242_02765, partial [Bacteroidota bacterium]